MREVCALRHLSINTEKSYTHWLGRFGAFLKDKTLTFSSSAMKTEAFLTRLALTGVSASSLIVHLLYGYGLRVSEPLNLRIKDVDLKQGRLYVYQA